MRAPYGWVPGTAAVRAAEAPSTVPSRAEPAPRGVRERAQGVKSLKSVLK